MEIGDFVFVLVLEGMVVKLFVGEVGFGFSSLGFNCCWWCILYVGVLGVIVFIRKEMFFFVF